MSFFFTLLDDSLRPRGSRDPLGIELLWSAVGRKLVGNLTTVTKHIDNFILTLVGYYLCGEEGQEAPDWECFERFEQMTARARVGCGLSGVLGVRRIKNSLDFPVTLGSGKNARILDDQRQAGLWGLYSTALKASGLTADTRQPNPLGLEIARELLKPATGDVWRIAVDKKHRQLTKVDMKKMEQWVVNLLSPGPGRTKLANCLLAGKVTQKALQGEVFEQAKACLMVRKDVPSVRDYLRWLTNKSEVLKDFAGRILLFDEALVLATLTFSWLLGCHGRSVAEVEKQLAAGLAEWPKNNLSVPDFSREINDSEWCKRVSRIVGFCAAINNKEWIQATNILLDHHAFIAKARGGSSWCYWEDDKIKVVMNTSPGTLPGGEIGNNKFEGWMNQHSNDFFLGSFLSILDQSGVVREKTI